MTSMNMIVRVFTLDEVIEQMIEIADELRLKSQHNPFADDLFEMGERLEVLADWLQTLPTLEEN